ncbi:VTT domain-containing protein [Kovacikia minuta CCNUW1]|uniref:DedA family protein n=1 Tax=Kovacikia minuta TaxID=2931930 RepID=UPI001CCBA64C|nr:VTT domain-containing protein [Kovacikia minuta]UBF25790.1 VTT domain-containing protein [Kovacikia minuta CCNUW1]
MHLDVAHLRHLIETLGFWGGHLAIWIVVFAESGLLVGFFLPGDSLLFTSGFLASQHILNIQLLLLGTFICAVVGDNVGYATGHKFGRRLFRREDSWFFHKKHLITAQDFYAKYGKKAIVLARFMPIVRTFAPIVAGIGSMKYRTFVSYNIVGGFIWTFGVTLLGYFLGQIIPDVDKYLLPIILVIVVVSIAPSILHLYQERKSNKH